MNAKSTGNEWGCMILGFFLCILVCIFLRLIDGTWIEAQIAQWMRLAGF